ncbi:hypothetical protein AVEN_180003-1 [Araneus ventricosus]|uniref:Uncharacterized protein n=1 Tax=Araneus ventricosus TaxID=182803 RepID=A0A4Y2U2X7_ARAVE|nr:hypothetical protein AVEN_126784-1 [Araneus ventricosus]GBO06322.1 hypothetical protein AVEN_264292-1 [Araneus ventricosus]GBO06334.1 hypothetical protein AVEN_180003-1 [Araneus ventricosus]
MAWWHSKPFHFSAHPFWQAIHGRYMRSKSIRYGSLLSPIACTSHPAYLISSRARESSPFPALIYNDRGSKMASPNGERYPDWLDIQTSERCSRALIVFRIDDRFGRGAIEFAWSRAFQPKVGNS